MMSMPGQTVVILSTAPASESAAMARALVDRGLVACVNVMPVRSIYRWKGEFCDDQEHLLIAKTTQEKVETVISEIKGMHPYEVPEIIAVPVIAGYVPYLEWVQQATEKDA
jgi:periplasmic divalent cation tolerance protein